MARPDPALLDPAHYPFHCQIETRFSDLDANLHINNVAFTDLLQEGRVRFHRASNYTGHSAEMTTMVVSLGIEYVGQGFIPDPIDMHVAIGQTGRTSFQLNQLITQSKRKVLFAQTTLVCVSNGQPCPIPPDFLAEADRWRFAG